MQLVQLADARRLRCQLAHFDERQSGGTSHGPQPWPQAPYPLLNVSVSLGGEEYCQNTECR